MERKTIVICLLILLIVVVTISIIFFFVSQPHDKLPYYVTDAIKRQDVPINVTLSHNDLTLEMFPLVEGAAKEAVENYQTRMGFPLFNYVTSPSNIRTITIGVEPAKHGCTSQFDGRLKVLAHAHTPGIRICLDSAEDWTHKTLVPTLMHELGHSIGLRHVTDRPSIMADELERCAPNLTDEDVLLINTMLDRSENTFRISYRRT